VLLILKFVAGVVAGSSAMVADAVHSLSDFFTDIVVLLFVRLSSKPQDKDHDYGHGKYETLATVIVGLVLFAVGVAILLNGIADIARAVGGKALPEPGWPALAAAVLSIAVKEWTYRFTVAAGRRLSSQVLVANAWHHRSDAMSSVGTAIGIGGAILLGGGWTVLDPIAAVAVSFFIVRAACRLLRKAVGELLEESLPEEVENEIVAIAEGCRHVSQVHHLRTRCIGNRYAIEMHVRMPGGITLYESHSYATKIEQKLRERFGNDTHVSLHVEPVKVDGQYRKPSGANRPPEE